MRISGVILPNKRIVIALTYIYGIGHTTAKKICNALNLDLNTKVEKLTDAQALQIEEHIVNNYTVESDLKNKIRLCISDLLRLNGFSGQKHKLRSNK